MASAVHSISKAKDLIKKIKKTSAYTCHPQVCDIIGHFEAIGHGLEIFLSKSMKLIIIQTYIMKLSYWWPIAILIIYK